MIKVEWKYADSDLVIPSLAMNSVSITISNIGYYALGIVSITGSGTGKVAISEFVLNDNTHVTIYFRNSTTDIATITNIKALILYKKTK